MHSGTEFLVLEKDPIVAADLLGGLQEALPDCSVHRFAAPPELIAHCEAHSAEDRARQVLITKLNIQQIEDLGLDRFAGSVVVRLGDDSADSVVERGWYSLPSPFLQDDLLGLARQLEARPAAA